MSSRQESQAVLALLTRGLRFRLRNSEFRAEAASFKTAGGEGMNRRAASHGSLGSQKVLAREIFKKNFAYPGMLLIIKDRK
jgi:hypothetical protein